MTDSAGARASPSTDTLPLSPPSGCRSPAAGGDDKFDELAGAVFEHCRNQLSNDDDDESFYPIVKSQQKRTLEKRISNKYVSSSYAASAVVFIGETGFISCGSKRARKQLLHLS